MSSGEHSSSSSIARWLAGILIGFILSSLGALSGVAMRHEGAIARDGERWDSATKQLDRMERKIDRVLRGEP